MPNFEDLAKAYEETQVGAMPPAAGYVSGEILNGILHTTKYTPKEMYFVSKDGIFIVTEAGLLHVS